MTALAYLKQELTLEGDKFIPMWRSLSKEDQDSLKEYARKEAEVLGIELTE